MEQLIRDHVDKRCLADLCRQFGITRLSIFGSAIREDFDPERSDIDVLAEFSPGVNKSLFTLVHLQDKLTALFGRQVDLTTPGSLSKYFRETTIASAEVIYDAA